MGDLVITSRVNQAHSVVAKFEDYVAAALTTGTAKKEWIVPVFCRLLDVIADSEVAGSGGVSDLLDINKNGTSIFTTQANRPTLLAGNTGMFTEAGEPEIASFVPGDVLSYDVDQVASTGSSRFKLCITFGVT